jgi:hypothetical protein
MKKTIAKILIGLALINGIAPTVETIEEGKEYVQEMTEPASSQTAVTHAAHAFQNDPYHIGPALGFAVSAVSLGAAAAINGKRAGRDIERVIIPRRRPDAALAEVANAFNQSEAGLGKLFSYICEDIQLANARVERISAVAKSEQLLVSVRVNLDAADSHVVEQLFEHIAELMEHKIEAAQHIVVEDRTSFDNALAMSVANEIKLGKEVLMKNIVASRARST